MVRTVRAERVAQLLQAWNLKEKDIVSIACISTHHVRLSACQVRNARQEDYSGQNFGVVLQQFSLLK